MAIIRYQRTLGHELEGLVANFLRTLPCVKQVREPSLEEDQLNKIDLWVELIDEAGELGLQVTCAEDSRILERKEKELRTWHPLVSFIRVSRGDARASLQRGALTPKAGSSVIRQFWQELHPARKQVLATAMAAGKRR